MSLIPYLKTHEDVHMKKAQVSTEIIKTIINVFLVVVFVFIPLISFSMTVAKSNVPKQKYLTHFYANIFNAMFSIPGNITVIAPFDGRYKLDVEKNSVSLISHMSAIVSSNYFPTRDFDSVSYYYANPAASEISFYKSKNVFLSCVSKSSEYFSKIKKYDICLVVPPAYYSLIQNLISSNKILVYDDLSKVRRNCITVHISKGSYFGITSKRVTSGTDDLDQYLAFLFYYHLKDLNKNILRKVSFQDYDISITFNGSTSVVDVLNSLLPLFYRLYHFSSSPKIVLIWSKSGDLFSCVPGQTVHFGFVVESDYLFYRPQFSWTGSTSIEKRSYGFDPFVDISFSSCPYTVSLTIFYHVFSNKNTIVTKSVEVTQKFLS